MSARKCDACQAPEMVAAREAAEQAAVQKKAAEEEWARIQAGMFDVTR